MTNTGRPPIKACWSVPRKTLGLAAFCSDDFHAVLVRNGIKAKKYASYEMVCIELSSGRYATLSLHAGRTFEIGLERVGGRGRWPERVCEADMLELLALLGIESDAVAPWQCGDGIAWLPIGKEPKRPPPPSRARIPKQRRPRPLASQVDALSDFIARADPHFIAAAPEPAVDRAALDKDWALESARLAQSGWAPVHEPKLRLLHEPLPPADARALAMLERVLNGVAPELLEFHRRCGGARLFADARDPETCFFLLPIAEMDDEKRRLADWLFMNVVNAEHEVVEEIDDDGRLVIDGVPDWWESALVFGGFGRAPERLFLATEGPHAGEVFLYEHDGDEIVRIATSVNELFRQIHADPVGFMRSYYASHFEIASYGAG